MGDLLNELRRLNHKKAKTIVTKGAPKELRDASTSPWVHDFLNRQEHKNK
jgi:hypothetical protein